jgi:hypothetical protein
MLDLEPLAGSWLAQHVARYEFYVAATLLPPGYASCGDAARYMRRTIMRM